MFIFNRFFLGIQLLFFKTMGEDEFKNRYYQHRFKLTSSGYPIRWCKFEGVSEPSKVPAVYHAWLHYGNNDSSIFIRQQQKMFWQKSHLPNLTGTIHAYNPRKLSSSIKSFYKSWKPNK